MSNKTIKLTGSDLRRIIRESVEKALGGNISLREFADILKWDTRYSSFEGYTRISDHECLNEIGLQFFNENTGWIREPRVFYRGTANMMSFPIIATDREMRKCVVINDRDELRECGEMWRNNDFSMLNQPLQREVIRNEKGLGYKEFERKVYAIAQQDKNIIIVDVDGNDIPRKAIIVKY